MVGIAMGLAPAVGPTMSGIIVDNYSWRDLFGVIIPFIIIILIIAFFVMKPVLRVHQQPLDFWSVVTSTIGFGGLLYGVSEASSRGWGDRLVLGFIIVGLIFIALFIHRQLKLKDPFLEMRVFKHPEFALAAVLSSAVNLAMIGVEMLLPTYIQTIRGETAFHSGLMLLPGALMMGFMQPITGRLFDKYGARRLAIVGLTMLLIGTVPFMTLTDKTPVLSIIVFYAIRLFGVSMVFMPVTTSGMNVLPIAEMSHGTAVNNTFRQTMSSIGTGHHDDRLNQRSRCHQACAQLVDLGAPGLQGPCHQRGLKWVPGSLRGVRHFCRRRLGLSLLLKEGKYRAFY